jgi:hypothetical protein
VGAPAVVAGRLRVYRAYGLGIRSAMALPELPAAGGCADVAVRRASLSDRACASEANDDQIWLRWPAVGTFVVRGGTEIVVDPAPDVPARVLRLHLLGPVLGALLRQRGLLVLHASAVRVGGEAVVFLGWQGWGKSTTAAALHARGHPVVADDISAVALTPDGAVLVAGIPRLKLWPEVGRALGERPERLPRVHPEREKREVDVGRGFSPRSTPLGRIYVLAEADRYRSDELRPADALVELLRHSYGAHPLRAVRTEAHFRQCARVARDIPARRLGFVRCLPRLASLAQFIEADVAQSVG